MGLNRQQRRNGPVQFPPGAFPNANQMQAAAGDKPPQIVLNNGPLMSDAQLICLTAAQCPGQAASAVDRAIEIVAVTLAKLHSGEVNRRIQKAQAAAQPAEPPKPPEEPALIS